MGTAPWSRWRRRLALLLASALIATAGLPASPVSALGAPFVAHQADARSGSALDNVSVSPVPEAAGNVGAPGRASTPLLDALVAVHRVPSMALLPAHAAQPSQVGIRSLAHSPSRERSPPAAL
jgi:hypothetical protein